MTTSDPPAHDHVWRQLHELLSGSDGGGVVLVAPFMKAEVVRAALAALPPSVEDVTLVTRWSAAEIAAGVSDVEVLDVVDADPRARLLLRHDLHAKIYRAGPRCLVGSANLTGRATGRVAQPNLELLLEVPAAEVETARVLGAAIAGAVEATAAFAASIRAQAEQLRIVEGWPPPDDSPSHPTGHSTDGRWWVPVSRAPIRLFGIYRGELADCPDSVLDHLLLDLARLDPPPGLDKEAFDAFVLARLTAWPAFRALEDAGTVTSTALEADLARLGPGLEKPAFDAETIVRWLEVFDPGLYVVQRGAYDIVRGRRMS